MWNLAVQLAETGWVPVPLLRAGIRQLLRARLRQIGASDPEISAERQAAFLQHMASAPIALVPEKANEQHYELPPAFFEKVLGPHRKYSCCYWSAETQTLADAEAEALQRTCDHAQFEDGHSLLDLGCGWGSLSLWIASRYPRSTVLAVSNAQNQIDYLREQASRRNLRNLQAERGDMNDFDPGQRFDRIVSVEMFEHMRNWPRLLRNVRSWLTPGGRFLMHVFVHRSVPYEYSPAGPSDWMSRYFFTGGMMPSDSLPLHCQEDLQIQRQWRWSGRHYARTCDAWLQNFWQNEREILPILKSVYGQNARLWQIRWQLFFLACAELFKYRSGQEWWVSHYLLAPRDNV